MRDRAIQTNKRVWEIDALRGALIFFVLLHHAYFMLSAVVVDMRIPNVDACAIVRAIDPLSVLFRINESGVVQRSLYYDIYRYTYLPGVDVFFVISGISCLFSRDVLNRALRVLGAGAFVAGFAKLVSVWTGDPSRFIRFGALFCYAFCQLIYFYFLKDRSNRTLLMVSIPVFCVGYYLRYWGVAATRLPILYIFGVPQIGDQSGDWWPVFPMLGWFLVGVILGRVFYAERKTRFPDSKAERLTRPLQWLGRQSGVIYVGHIVVYTAVFCGTGYLFGLL